MRTKSDSRKGGTPERVLLLGCDALQLMREENVSLDDYLDIYLPDPDFRRLLGALLSEYFRYKVLFSRELTAYVRKVPAPYICDVILLTLIQCRILHTLPPPVAVDVAIAVLRQKESGSVAAFANAVLRKMVSSAWILSDSSIIECLPPAVLKHWRKFYDDRTLKELANCFLAGGKFTFRACGEYVPKIECSALSLDFCGPYRFYTAESGAELVKSEALREGKIYIQDPAPAMSATMTQVQCGAKVLDLCAAPGGKSLLLWEGMKHKGTIVAADRSARRQRMTQDNFRRYHVDGGKVITFDGAQESNWKALDCKFDLVFVDAPCSNTGVFRRRPDALHRFSSKALLENRSLQWKLLQNAAKAVISGGTLLYSTCSIEPDENMRMIKRFLEHYPNEFILEEERQLLPGAYHDGAYAARLRRK